MGNLYPITESRSVQPFLHSSRQSVVGDVGACPSPKNCPFPYGDLNPHLTRGSLCSTWLSVPNGTSVGSVVYAQLTADSQYTLQWDPIPQKLPLPTRDWTLICCSLSGWAPASRSVQPFAGLLEERPYTLQWAASFPQNCPFPWRDLDPI